MPDNDTQLEPNKGVQYIQTRINSLQDIDTKIVSFIDNLSSTLDILKDGKKHPGSKKKSQLLFNESINKVYSDLSFVATHLRKEIKIWDTKVNSNSNTQGDLHNLNILPIQINKKATWVNKSKVNEELYELKNILGNDFKLHLHNEYKQQSQSLPVAIKSELSETIFEGTSSSSSGEHAKPVSQTIDLTDSPTSKAADHSKNGGGIEVIDLDNDVFDSDKQLSKTTANENAMKIDDSDVNALFESNTESKSGDPDIKMEL